MSLFFDKLFAAQTQFPAFIFSPTSGEFLESSELQETDLLDLTRLITRNLERTPRIDPKDALESSASTATRIFLKTLPLKWAQDDLVKQCHRALFAYQLGIPVSALDNPQNKDFETFAKTPPLARYLASYGDHLEVRENQEIWIKVDKTFQSWASVRKELMPPEKPPKQYQLWTYGPQGAQRRNAFEWEKLSAYRVKKIDPERGPFYLVKICACLGNAPRWRGDHTWIELISRKGKKEKCFGIGLYSPYDGGPQQKRSPLAVQKGYLMSPDVSRWWPDQIFEILRPVTKEQWDKLIAIAEQDKKLEREGAHQPIQIVGRNCTSYALSLLQRAEIPTPKLERNIYSLLTRHYGCSWVTNVACTIDRFIPRPLSTCMQTVSAFCLNMALYSAGAGKNDPDLPKTEPHFGNKKDLLEWRKTRIDHPWAVRRVAINETKAFRDGKSGL